MKADVWDWMLGIVIVAMGLFAVACVVNLFRLANEQSAFSADGGTPPAAATRKDPILEGRAYCFMGGNSSYGGPAKLIHRHGDLWTLKDPSSDEWITIQAECIIWHGRGKE